MQNLRNSNMAYARISGASMYPKLSGTVSFKQMKNGVLVKAEIYGLPYLECKNEIYGFHIHEGTECSGDLTDEFKNAKDHFNKSECNHPYHSGDMPPLFGNNGYAYMTFFTNRFTLSDIIGKVVIIHANMDDLKTNPSGNSGQKIACGKISY